MGPVLSPLHLALGEPASPLTYDLVARAIPERIPESAQLDWKQALPGSGDEQRDEFAKDVAAMANAEGGLIVYGMAEDRATSTASKIFPVETTDGAVRRLSQVISTRIHPMPQGVAIDRLNSEDGEDEQRGLVVVTVPASVDAPHFVGTETQLRVPVRNGASTRNLKEYEIAREYARRFNGDNERAQRLDALQQRLLKSFAGTGFWLVATARPISTHGSATAVDADEMRRTVITAKVTAQTLGTHHGRSTEFGNLEQNFFRSRIGLRRRTLDDAWSRDPDSTPVDVSLELHEDGTVGLAESMAANEATDDVRERCIDAISISIFARDLVAMLAAHAAARGTTGRYQARIDLVTPDPLAGGVLLWAPRIREGSPTTLGGVDPATRSVSDFVTIDVIIDTTAPESYLDSARAVALDVLAQFGSDAVVNFPPRDPAS